MSAPSIQTAAQPVRYGTLDDLWRPAAPSRATRKIKRRSTGSGRALLVGGAEPHQMDCESGLERRFDMLILVRRGIVDIREQPEPVTYFDAAGQGHFHTFDFLATMADAPVVAPVLSQPSLPLPIGARRAADLGCSAAELSAVKAKVADGAQVLGLRFSGDTKSPAARFESLRRELGDGFIGVQIDSAPGNPYGNRKGAHSVLTEDLIDREGSPTRAALEQVLDFLSTRLEVTQP